MRGTRILELGSGVGFLGIVIASLQMSEPAYPASVWLTDVNSDVLARCSANLSLPCSKRGEFHTLRQCTYWLTDDSAAHPSLKTSSLDWTDSLDEAGIPRVQVSLQDASPDIILGADIVSMHQSVSLEHSHLYS